jgi:hypothetical protein
MVMTMRSSTGGREARRARSRALRLVPANGAIDDLVAAVGQERGRPLSLLAAELGPMAPTGMWVATDHADYIVYPADASSAERAAVICHELAHMLLGHQPEAQMDRVSQMARTVAPSIDPDVARRILQRHGYAEQVEADAERLATVLVTKLARNAEAIAVRRDAVSERLR